MTLQDVLEDFMFYRIPQSTPQVQRNTTTTGQETGHRGSGQAPTISKKQRKPVITTAVTA